MTPDERNLLDQFLSDLARAKPATKDAEAADRIDRSLRGNPDGAYVLVQHAILADQALAAANDRIAELERQLPPPQRSDDRSSFLGSAVGGAPPNPYGPNGSAVPPTAPGAYGYGGAGPAWGGGAQPGPFSGGGGIGNFLRSAGTTAAGVAGGAFLFEGLSGIFGGHHGGFGGGQGFGGFGGGDNVTINEFDGGRDGGGYDDGGSYDDN